MTCATSRYVYRDVREAAKQYVCQRLRKSTRGALLLGMSTAEVWGDVMTGVVTHALGRRVGRGKGAGNERAEVAADDAEGGVRQPHGVCRECDGAVAAVRRDECARSKCVCHG